jgi:2-oxoglutarate dehydrogenase E1 component
MAENGRSEINLALLDTTFLQGANAAYVERLYAKFEENPAAVEPQWRDFFASLGDRDGAAQRAADGASWTRTDWPPRANGELTTALGDMPAQTEARIAKKIAERSESAGAGISAEQVRAATLDSIRALMMIRAYRIRGHLAAQLDPLGIEDFGPQPELDPATYGFGAEDMDRQIFIDEVLGLETASPRQMIEILRRTYCGAFGVEFMHISNPEEKAWIQERIEGPDKEISFTAEGQRAILKKLVETESFERFLHRRYPGTKRFGIDGGESLIPALEQVIKRGGALGVDEIVLGMPHRGRLNVLGAVMGKPYRKIFHEFQGGSTQGGEDYGSGDVKYHLGSSSDREFDGNRVHLSLTANPSHLEAVNPVVLGKARAKQFYDQQQDPTSPRTKVMPLLLHGDAAFAGQGIVAECLGLSGLTGHRTGGTVHFIVNNQIGFTTSPRYSRSSPYPTDVAKMVEAPIFHVNGDDPEAVVFAAKVATEYRQRFAKDVVVDIFCYRRFGHNEGDDPTFTQPVMYQIIKDHPTTREVYSNKLIEDGVITQDELDAMTGEFEAFLESEFQSATSYKANEADWLDGSWQGLGLPEGDERRGDTGVDIDRLRALGRKITEIPADVAAHKTLARVIGARREMIDTGQNVDWSTAEHLAFASLLDEGFPVRLSGQDSARGTFSQRHSHIVDQDTEERYTPLNNLREGQGPYEVIDSMLSEEAVLGFEYGYSTASPNTLVLWEAQFGDFANGAQVLFDQFISSGERKWLRMSGLVMLLPHAYEGQGPEHSSARLERFLQMCAEDNWQVANCSTPANYFHILRRQIHRNFRKPLVLMTPKSLLRHKRAVSRLDEMGRGSSFHRVLWDDAETKDGKTDVVLRPDAEIKRVICCSGKVYYDLLEEREKRGVDDVYLMRVEQFYPAPVRSLLNEMRRFPNADAVWCQEEPRNMGAWTFMEPNLEWVLDQAAGKAKRPIYVGRPASASTATGLMSKHLTQLRAFMDEAFTY